MIGMLPIKETITDLSTCFFALKERYMLGIAKKRIIDAKKFS
jgi:hypothetical protein